MNPIHFNVAAVLLAAVSALFWALSARVKFQFGYDMDAVLDASMRKAAKLNAWGATFAALAVLGQASAMFLDVYAKTHP